MPNKKNVIWKSLSNLTYILEEQNEIIKLHSKLDSSLKKAKRVDLKSCTNELEKKDIIDYYDLKIELNQSGYNAAKNSLIEHTQSLIKFYGKFHKYLKQSREELINKCVNEKDKENTQAYFAEEIKLNQLKRLRQMASLHKMKKEPLTKFFAQQSKIEPDVVAKTQLRSNKLKIS